MANNPNNNNSAPIPPDDESRRDDGTDSGADSTNEISFEFMHSSGEIDLSEFTDFPDAEASDAPLATPVPPAEESPADIPEAAKVNEAAYEELLEDLPDAEAEIAEAVESPGNLEPLYPVAPASGWLDEDSPAGGPQPIESPLELEVNQADLFDAPPDPAIESSDIFSSGSVLRATNAESSDVIEATAFGEALPVSDEDISVRPSEVAISFNLPPQGSTVSQGGSGDLPIAEELVDGESVFDIPEASPFDSANISEIANAEADTFTNQDDDGAVDYSVTNNLSPDASSILADLSDPEPTGFDDTSSVRLEAPGSGRSYPDDLDEGTGEGTEFDLSVFNEEAVPPELMEAEAAADAIVEPADWIEVDDAEIATGADPTLSANPPHSMGISSIFPPGGGVTAGPDDSAASGVPLADAAIFAQGESDSSVEFSDQPLAEDESLASQILSAGDSGLSDAPLRAPSASHPDASPSTDSVIDWDLSANLDAAGIADILNGGSKEPTPQMEDEPTLPDGRSASPSSTAKPGKPNAPRTSDPSFEIDWIERSGSADQLHIPEEADAVWDADAATATPESLAGAVKAAADEPARSKGKDKTKGKAKDKERIAATSAKTSPDALRRPSGKAGWVGGTLLGMLIAGGGWAGAYFGGFLPGSPSGPAGTGQGLIRPPGSGNPNTPAGNPVTVTDVAAALRAGNPARAKELAAAVNDETPTGKALAGEAQLFALVQTLKPDATIPADDPDLKATQENLKAVVEDAEIASTPEGERTAVRAAVRLGISHELAGNPAAARKVYEDAAARFPRFASTFEAALDRLTSTVSVPAVPAPVPDGGNSRRLTPADARQLLFAITLLQSDDPPAAPADEPEAGVYFWKAVNRAAGEKFTEAIEQIKKAKAAHIKQARAMPGGGLNPLSDPLEQIFARSCDDLQNYWELRAAIYSNKPVADLFKNEGPAKAVTQLASAQKKAAEAVVLMTNLKDATEKLTTASRDLKDAQALVTKLEKDVKAADIAKLAVEEKLIAEEKARVTAQNNLAATEKAREASDAVVASLARELQTAKLLPGKFDTAELLAAQKAAADRATGPNLATLVPPGMMAVAGAGLSSAQLVDVADRLVKAELAAKVASDRLAIETKRITTEHADAMKKLAEVHATNVAKLKDDQTAELKKAADEFAADAKKLADGFDAKMKDLQLAVAKEKEAKEAAVAQFKRDLGNAISPNQALDLWLPLLIELRRRSDTDPALATAEKVLASAPAESEDAGKAHTVAGLAFLFKGDRAAARMQFQRARTNPTHAPARAAEKLWATAADIGLESVTDPLALYRTPIELPKRDTARAARYLDAGIRAYKEDRFADAMTALTESTKADPTNPVAWYFLGSAKWARGMTDQANDDFRQGAVREAASNKTTRTITESLTVIQGAPRDALTAARP